MDAYSDVIRFLKSLTHFAGLQNAAMQKIASRCRLRTRLAGENLFVEGDPCRDLYILVSGRVKCFRASPEGREQILKVFDCPGDMFCTTSAFNTGSHIVTAEAMNDVNLYVVNVATMKRVALEQPAVALALVTTAGDQMRSLVSLELDIAKGKMLPAGSIFEMPATIRHFGWTTEETIIQEHGIGPLSVNYLKPVHDSPHR